MKKAVTKKKAPAMVVIEGEMNIYRAAELKDALIAGLESAGSLEVDISGVEEIDTSGLQILVLAKLEAARSEKIMSIIAKSRAVETYIDLYNLRSFFDADCPARGNRTGENCHGK